MAAPRPSRSIRTIFRLRFSLRVALLLCAAIAVAMAFVRIWYLEPALARADAELMLHGAGVTVSRNPYLEWWHFEPPVYKGRPPPTRGNRLRWPPPLKPRPRTLQERLLCYAARREVNLDPVTEISFVSAERHATDQDIDALRCFPEVTKLDLTVCEVTHPSPQVIRSQNVGSKEITDKGLAKIAELPALRELVVTPFKATDAACQSLARNRSLQVLSLAESQITDEGLQRLAAIPTLRKVSIRGTRITNAGIEAFHRRRPDVKVVPSTMN